MKVDRKCRSSSKMVYSTSTQLSTTRGSIKLCHFSEIRPWCRRWCHPVSDNFSFMLPVIIKNRKFSTRLNTDLRQIGLTVAYLRFILFQFKLRHVT